MRKIISQEEINKKKKRNVTILSIFMLAVMVIGTAGYAFLSGDGYTTNTDTQNVGGAYTLTFNGQTLYFLNSQSQVQDVEVLITSNINSFTNYPLYIDAENELIFQEIAFNVGKFTRVQEACYGVCEKDIPEKDCTENLIIWKDSGENKVYQQDKCIFIEGDVRAADAFLYKIFSAA